MSGNGPAATSCPIRDLWRILTKSTRRRGLEPTKYCEAAVGQHDPGYCGTPGGIFIGPRGGMCGPAFALAPPNENGSRAMNILLVTPAPPGSRKGNRVTALRWAGLLRQLGHRVLIRDAYHGERCDLLIALHAGHSFAAVDAFRRAQPKRPIILALTGTDVYKA